MTTVTLAGLFILMIMIGKPSCHGPGTVLSVPHLLIQFSQQPYQVGVVNITPLLQMRKLWHREVK